MAQQLINHGTVEGDGTGESPFSGMQKVNENFTELYSAWSSMLTTLSGKAPIANPTFTGTVGGITKSMIGLGNVDNTPDTSKPVSTPQQAAIDLNANNRLKVADVMPDFMASVPTTPAINTVISSPITLGAFTAYVSGTRFAKSGGDPELSHTYGATRDVYVDMSNTGSVGYKEVANGAAAPSIDSGSFRLYKIVTDASKVTAVTRLGKTFDDVLNGGLAFDGFAAMGLIRSGGVVATILTDWTGSQPAQLGGIWIPRTNSTLSALQALDGKNGELSSSLETGNRAIVQHNGVAGQAITFYPSDVSFRSITQTDLDNRKVGYLPSGEYTVTVGSSETLYGILTYLNGCSFHNEALVSVIPKAGADASGPFLNDIDLPNVAVDNNVTVKNATAVSVSGSTVTFTIDSTASMIAGQPVGIALDIPAGSPLPNQYYQLNGVYAAATILNSTQFTVTLGTITGQTLPAGPYTPSGNEVYIYIPSGWMSGVAYINRARLQKLNYCLKSGFSFSDVKIGSTSLLLLRGVTGSTGLNSFEGYIGTLISSGGLTFSDSRVSLGSVHRLGGISLKAGTTLLFGNDSTALVRSVISLSNNTTGNGITCDTGSLCVLTNNAGGDNNMVFNNCLNAANVATGGRIICVAAPVYNNTTNHANVTNGTLQADGSFVGGMA